MRLDNYLNEWKYIELITRWDYQNQFYNFPSLDEMFDKPIKINITTNTIKVFETDFYVVKVDDKEKYDKWIFQAKKVNTKNTKKYKNHNIWGIGFHIKDDTEMFKSKRNEKYPGDVFSGVFRSLEELLKRKSTINGIIFNTNDVGLKPLYVKMIPWVEKRFPEFKLKSKSETNGLMDFLYLRERERKKLNETE